MFYLCLTLVSLWKVNEADTILSNIVNTKYGKVQGILRHYSRPNLSPIDVFLGVPYASPPVGDGRFTPTSSPLPWEYVKKCDTLPPVCPQPLWDNDNKHIGSIPMEVSEYYKSFRPILQNQNEDCLYLNIYTPHDGGGGHPVFVYVHGDSFSWGSGNLYDGGFLAAHGQMVVIIVNYRLGPLGFLNTSPGGGRSGVVSNQGLMDQLAALSWVKENVDVFGGDPDRVTIAGHSTGAACIGYLIASPVVVPGLFHRAMLMSGSPFSPWSEVPDALSVTIRLAKLLNCSVPDDLNKRHPETMGCLRNVSAHRLVNAPMPKYKFASVYGPSIDGIVIAGNFKERLRTALKSKQISLMFGVAEGDAYAELNREQAAKGFDMAERNRIFRTFVRNTYQHHLQEIYLAIAKEYTNWGNPSHHPFEIRDLAIDALSDGSYLAPLIKFADIVSARSQSYMYVFNHYNRDHARFGSAFRSEVSLLFGTPFQDQLELPLMKKFSSSSASATTMPLPTSASNFSRSDAVVSEYLMNCVTNFARSGNPNGPNDVRPILSFGGRTKNKNVSWDAYDPIFEKYLELSSRPRLRDHYKAHNVALWNWLLPELEDAGSKYPDSDSEKWHKSDDSKYFIGPVRPLDPFRFLKPTQSSETIRTSQIGSPIDGYLTPNVSAAQGSLNRQMNNSRASNKDEEQPLLDYTTALTLTVAIGVSLLMLNIILFAALLYKRERHSLGPKMKYDSVSVQPLCTVDSGLRSTPTAQESGTPPTKVAISTCSPTDPQCTELHTFQSPPDIGDRNTEVSFHTSGSLHSILSQPTSQFIPPPPLLSTTPPSPPPTTISSEPPDNCSQQRCYTEPVLYPEGVHFDVKTAQYPTESDAQCATNFQSSEYHDRHRGQQCVDSSKCSVSCPYNMPSCQSPVQYCGASQCSPTCSYPLPSPDGTRYPETSYTVSTGSPSKKTNLPASRSGQRLSSTLNRQTCGPSVSRKPQPPVRVTASSSYSTLPRQNSRDSPSRT